MPRALVIGNGRLLINFDARLTMRDLYYPRVGMLNHISGHRNAVGLWVDGIFTWLDGEGWRHELAYEEETLVTACTAVHQGLGLQLQIHDAVHYREDLYLKQVTVRNLRPSSREIRLFFTHDFSIDQTDIGDTALYDLTTDAVMHYKRDKCFLLSGRVGEQGLFQYATGTKRFGGAEGTWRDAEDGWLEGNPIAQGSVDSTISFRLQVSPNGEQVLHYWIAVGSGFEEVRRLHGLVLREGLDKLMDETRAYWRAWVNKKDWDLGWLDTNIQQLFKRSLLIVRTQIDRGGAILAANDTDILQFNRDHYSYMWPRDGALVAYALDEAGYPELTREFYRFCARARAPGGFLWHKYNPDGSVGSSWHPWLREGESQLPIQEDETALVLYALWHFFEREHDLEFLEPLYEQLVKPAAEFMLGYRDGRTHLPLDSYDLWEERRGVFTFTCASVWAGLRAAARFAETFGQESLRERYERAADEVREAILRYLYDPDLGRFLRGLYIRSDGEMVKDETLESSLASLFQFGLLPADDRRVVATMEAIREGLWVKTPVGGIARYSRDYYHRVSGDFHRVPGNPWVICTLWLADWYIQRARVQDELRPARELLRWTTRVALSTGVLPEQLHPETGHPVSVAPLTWSHAQFILTVLRYCAKARRIREQQALAVAWHASPYSS